MSIKDFKRRDFAQEHNITIIKDEYGKYETAIEFPADKQINDTQGIYICINNKDVPFLVSFLYYFSAKFS